MHCLCIFVSFPKVGKSLSQLKELKCHDGWEFALEDDKKPIVDYTKNLLILQRNLNNVREGNEEQKDAEVILNTAKHLDYKAITKAMTKLTKTLKLSF